MTKSALPKSIIIDLPYQSIDDKAEIEKAFVEQLGYETLSAVERETLHYIFDYPTVYVVHSKKRNQHTLRPEYTVYVGETNNIRSRTMHHLREDPKTRVDWKEIIYVFLTIFLYLLKCPQSLILSALRAFCFCGKPHISRSIFLYFRYQSWLKSW